MIAAAGIVIPASAFTIYYGGGDMVQKNREDVVKTESVMTTRSSIRTEANSTSAQAPNIVVKVAPRQEQGENEYAKYGELIPVLEEDFSKMVSGSKGAPDMETRIWNDQKPGDDDYIPWTNMKPEYTHDPLWGGYNVYQAGGMVYMDQTREYAHINTPYTLDVSQNSGICILEFDMETVDDENPMSGLMIEAAETRNMTATWDIMGSQYTGEIPAGKHTVSALFYGGGPTSLFNIIPAGQDAVYLDNIKVYSLKQHIATPVARSHSEYKGTSFKANWDAVEGADSYLVSVYSLDETDPSNPIRNFVVEDKPATENSVVIDGVESGVTYYYIVKSVKGEYTSLPSVPMRVFDVEAPKMQEPAVDAENNMYTAYWDIAPNSERFNYAAYRLRVAEADGPFVIADEDFEGVTDEEGISNDWTFDDPDPEQWVYNEYYITTGMKQRGWYGKNCAVYYNSLCFDAFHYFYAGEDSGLVSQEMDLSKDGGKATITITAAGEFLPAEMTGVTDLQGNPVDLQVEAAVAVFNYDERVRDYVQSELIYAHDVNKDGMSPNEMREFTFNITKGTERSIIGIYAVGGPGNLYLDDFKIVQNYKAGDEFYDAFEFDHWYDGTQVDVKLPPLAYGYDIYHQVQSVRSMSVQGSAEFAVSEFSPREFVFKCASGVGEFEADDNTRISVDGGVLTVNASGEVSVYGVDGSLVGASTVDGGFTCPLPAKGIYLVKVAGKTVKVVY